MENKDKPTFYNPNSYSMQGNDGIGLTKREYFAGLVMQGLCANRWTMENGYYRAEGIAKLAVKNADELLKQLEEKENQEKQEENGN